MSRWTTKLGCHSIYTQFGVTYGRERARHWLHTLGVRLRRLRQHQLRAQPEEQTACVPELSPLVEDWPQDRARLFVDAAPVRRHPTLTAHWCLGDDVPEVPTGDDHTQVPVYGAVAPLTGQTHSQSSPAWGQGAFARCLRHLLRDYRGKPRLVIHDGAAQHKGPPITTARKDAEGRLPLKRQPAYAPALHPQERIWKGMRRVVTHNDGFETLSEDIQARRHFVSYLTGRKTEIQQLCGLQTPESLLASL